MEPEVGAINPREVFEEVFREHFAAVRAYVRRAWSSLDADDLVSATFETAWRRFDSTSIDTPRGWLYGVARNCALNELRARRRRADHLESLRAGRISAASDLFDDTVSAEVIAALRRALARLKPSDQEVLLLAAWGNLSGEDLGAALGVSASAAAVRLSRARQRLRAAYEPEEGLR